MVAGDLPFGTESIMQTMYQRVTEDPKSPQLLNPGVPDYLAAIIMRCLNRDPEKRYQSAADILKDLDRGAGPPPDVAPEASVLLTRPPEIVPRKRKMTAVWAGVGVFALLLALVFAMPRTRQMVLGLAKGSSKFAAGPSKNAKFVAI